MKPLSLQGDNYVAERIDETPKAVEKTESTVSYSVATCEAKNNECVQRETYVWALGIMFWK